MKELILTWNHGAETSTIRFSQTKTASQRFRIGRDPVRCDLVLPSATPIDLTVSKLHVELYFDPALDSFYLQNLKGVQNPPKIYGQIVHDVPVPIDKDGILQLGQQDLHLKLVTPKPIPPTILEPLKLTTSEPIPPTVPQPKEPEALLKPESNKPLVCPHCATGYTYQEAAMLNGRCPKDGFLLHGDSIYLPPDR